jgi:hypothetical protein
MTELWTKAAIVLKAFELAQRLCPERSEALAVTRRAWAVLDVAVAVQDKRLYYRPQRQGGREPSRTKVFLCEAHLLQRLICSEAERTATADSQTGFTAIFLAGVVRRALERNSFYAALAVTRVLHDYSTREGMRLYAGLVNDSERVRSEDYWRSRKSQLMSELLRLYGERLELRYGMRGEERFAAVDDVDPLVPLVEETLAALTPWGTPCVVTEELDAFLDGVPQLAWSGDAAEDRREVERMHALVHPACFQRLTCAAGLDAPKARLAIPRLLCSKGDDGEVGRRSPLPLEEHEQAALFVEMEGRSRRRREAPNVCLAVLVDGIERGRIEPERHAVCRVAVGSDATRVEVVTTDLQGSEPLLLAWLPLERAGASDGFRPLRRTLTLEGGQRLTFVVTPGFAGEADRLPTAEVLVRYQETAMARRLALGLRRLRIRARAWAQWPVSRPVLVSLAVFGLAVMVFRVVPWPSSSSMPAALPSLSELPPVQPPSSRGPKALPVEPDRHPSDDGLTRSLTPRPVGVGLAKVHVLWLNVTAATPSGSAVVRRIEDQLAASGFVLSRRPEEADAALEIELLQAPAAEDAGNANVHWRLRVVNAAGAVLWPTAGAPRDYRGPLSLTVSQMARELASVLATPRAHRSDRP